MSVCILERDLNKHTQASERESDGGGRCARLDAIGGGRDECILHKQKHSTAARGSSNCRSNGLGSGETVYVDHLQASFHFHIPASPKTVGLLLEHRHRPPITLDGFTTVGRVVAAISCWVRRLSAMHDTPILPIPSTC